MKKIIGITLTILLILVCISAVNADDSLINVDSNLNDSSNLTDNISLSDDSSHNHTSASSIINPPIQHTVWTASGGTFTQLQTIINASNPGDTIEITGNYYYDAGFQVTGILISKDLTINGNNHTLDGMDTGTIFVSASGVSLTLKDIIFTHGRSNNYYSSEPRGGAVWASGPTYVYNCTFINNTASYWGAGLEFWGGVAYIDGCYFIDNHGTSDLTINGGQTGYITRCYFKSNETYYAMYLNSGYVSRSTFLRTGQYVASGPGSNYITWGMNWWGSNFPDFSLLGFTPDSWIVMNFTNTSSFASSSVNLITSLNTIYNYTANTYQPLTEDIIVRPVNYTINTGSISSLNSNFVNIDNQVYSYSPGSNVVITSTVDNQTLKITHSPNIGSYTELQYLIDNTPAGSTLNLNKNYTFDLTCDLPFYRTGMKINKSITINGNGHYISGMNTTLVFQILSTVGVNFENIIFKEGYARNNLMDGYYRGGAFYSYNSDVTVLNCTFKDNYALNYGGAIEVYYGSINIVNSTFINNSATSEYGVILVESANGNVSGCVFINNTGVGYSVFYIYNGIINNNVFVNNSGTYAGGYLAIGNSNNNWWGSNTPPTYTVNGIAPETWVVMNFTNTTPITRAGGIITLTTTLNTIYNRTSLTYSPLLGTLPARTVYYNASIGSVSPTSSTINQIHNPVYTFPANNGLLNIYANIDNQQLIISTGSYTYLQSLIDSTPDGGILNLDSEIAYSNITDYNLQSGMIINKSITINGNGHNISGLNQARIFKITTGNVTLNDLNMSNGYWDYAGYGDGGGAIILSGFETNLTINNCSFENNWVSIWGGAIFATSFHTFIINNSKFKNNTHNRGYQGPNYGHGGAIMLTYANDAAQFVGHNFIVNNSIFTNNSITPSYGQQYGASIFTGYITNITITKSVFIDEICNGTTIYGGILSLCGGGVNRNITNNVFITSKIGTYGSAIYSGIAGDFNNNWWGNNTPNFNTLLYGGTVPETWFIMNISSINSINPYSSGSILINTTLDTIFNQTDNTTTKVINALPERTVNYTVTTGSLSTYSSNITNNHINTFNYPANLLNVYLNATIDNQTLTLIIPDLTLDLNVSTLNPQIGSKFIIKINITNNGPENLTFTQGYEAVIVNFTIPSPFLFISSSDGNYSNDTGLWYVGNLSVGESKQLNITLRTPANQGLIGTIIPINTSANGHFLTYNPNKFYDNKTLTIQNKTHGSYTDLQELIDSTPTNGILNIPWDVYYDNETDLWLKQGMYLNRSMTINGSGHTISGLDQARIFWITGLNVTINDLNLTHGWWGTTTRWNGGGALYIYGSNVNVTINNCNFTDNFVAGWGGAIYSQICDSIRVINCYFENNTDTVGSSSAGGAIMLHNGNSLVGNLFELINSTVINNHILPPTNDGQVGGSVYAGYMVNINIIGSTFINNTCNDTSISYGGALYLLTTGKSTVNYNVFINNYAMISSEIYLYAGAYDINYNWWGTNNPYWPRLTSSVIPETWILMNFTTNDILTPTGGNINLKASLNTAYNRTTNNYTNLTRNIPNRTVIFNTNTGSLSNTISNISDNVSTTLTYPSPTNLIVNATIDNQTLTLNPVNIDLKITNITKTNPQYGSKVVFTVNITNNGPTNITYDCGLDALVLNITLPSPLIYLNSTDTNYYNDTGLWYIGNLTVNQTKSINITFRIPSNSSLIGTIIPINTSIAWGHFLTVGTIYDNVSITIQNKSIGSYTDLQELIDATPTGGILNLPWNVEYDPLEDLWLKQGMYLNRSITVNGSGHYISGIDQARIFWITGLNVTINDLNMTHGWWGTTTAWNGGGALYIYGSNVNVTINHCNFTDNFVAGWGGAIYSQIFDSLIINDSYFNNNTDTVGSSSAGGAIMLHNGNSLCGNLFILENSTFIDNNIQPPTNNGQYGGAVYAWYITNISIIGNTFFNNSCKDTSASYGGALFLGSGIGSTVNYNNFLDDYALYFSEIYLYAGPYDINYNWWGTNNPNWAKVMNIIPETWIIMNFTSSNYQINPTSGNQEFIATLNTAYNRTSNNYTNISRNVPNRTVIFDTNMGSLSTTVSNITDKVNTTLSYSSINNNFYINATIDNQTLSLRLVDVELNITNITKTSPQIGDRVTFTVNITNHGDYNITYSPGLDGIVVSLPLPSPLIHISSNYDGYWDKETGLWFVGNLSVNQTKSINITFRVPFNKTLIGNLINLNASVLWGHFLSTEKLEDNITLELQDKTTGSYTDLQDFIDSTPTGGVLNLSFNVTYDPVQDVWLQAGMLLNRSISIIGNGFTISGLNQARIFLVSANYVNLSNISFINGYAFDVRGDSYRGGAIFSTGDWLNITNCTFKDNYATGYAGAIDQWVGNLIVDQSNFIGNNATEYGAIVIDVHSNTAAYITNSVFNKNKGNTYSTLHFYIGNLSNNAFVDEIGPAFLYTYVPDINNNWWGNNTPILTRFGGYLPETWVVMNFTNITPIDYSSGISTLLVSLDTIYNRTTGNYSNLIGTIPNRTVTFNWTSGSVTPSTNLIQGNTTSTFSYPANMGFWRINATIDNQTLMIGSTDLGIYITSNKNPINDGENITINITVINNGLMDAIDVNISIILPYGLINLTFENNSGIYNNTTNIWYFDIIHPGENFTLTINGTLADPGPELLINATIENNTSIYEENFTNNTYLLNVTVIQWSDLEIIKNISNLHPQTKGNVTYIITVFNHGPSTAINVTVSDNLSTNLIFLNYSSTHGIYNESTGIWFINNITPNTNETLNITVLVNKSGFTNNFVNVSCSHNDTNWTNNYDNISFETPPLSDIWVTITMEPQTSNYITYHIQAGNNGIEPTNGTIVLFNHSNLYIYYNHTEDKGVYNNNTGVWDIGYLDVNETVNLTLIVRLDFPTAITFANITTSVNITSWSTDLYPENNTDNVTFEAEIFGNFRLLQDIVDSWPENTIQILPRSFAYDPIQDARLPGETYDLYNGVRLYKNITIINPYGFTLGGYDQARIFNISADNIILDGLKFADGYSPLGAALNIHANNIQVLRSTFTGNWLFGDYGGAIFTNGANTLIQDNKFWNNTASKLGGAIGAVGATNLKILNNTFINNTVESDSVFGGAIGIINSTATVNNNVFLDNQATNAPNLGRAIYTSNSNVNLEANWFGNNTPDMITEELIYGVKPETYIILDWEIINPNMNNVTLNAVFLLYNTTSGNKTPMGYGIPYRNINIVARDPTLTWYNTTYTGNTTVDYTYNVAIPVYQVNATVDYQTITLEWSTFLDAYKSLVNDTIWFGDNLIYIINLTNYGPHNSYIIDIADLLPENLIINNITTTTGSTSILNDNIYWSLVITAGTNETLIVNTTPTQEKIYTNNLTVNSTNPYDYFLHGNTSVTGEVLPLIDLKINLTLSNPPYYVGEEINYTITIHNKGPSNATNVTVNIPIPTGLTFLYAWNLNGYIPDYNPSTGIWNVSTLNANETIQINMTLKINNPGWYNQTINITGYGVELNTTDNNITQSFNITTQVDLELNMTINKNETLYGDTYIVVTYTLLNKGPSPATNVSVFTIFNGLTYGWASGYGSFTNTTPFLGYWNIGNLNNGTIVTLNLVFYAYNIGNFTITGRANCSDNESYWPNNYNNVSINIIKYADLSITKTVSNSTPFLEDTITYTITITNNAGFNATDVIVYDPLPNVLIYNNTIPNFNGTHWNVGNLSVGESKNLTFNVTVDGIGTIWNNATVNCSMNDSNPNNNHAEVSIDVPTADDLRMFINTIPTNPASNTAFIINLSVWNRGFTDNQNVTVEFHMPSGLIYINSTNMGAYNPGTGLWDIGFLGNGAWDSLLIWVYPAAVGNITATANVSGFVPDVAPWNNRANITFEIVPAFDLTITKNANTTNIEDGDLIGFDISVWNNGPYTATNVKITDYLPNGLLYYSNNASGIYDNITRTVNWTINTLNTGDNITFHLTLRAWNPGLSFTNTVTANAYGTDSNTTDNTATVTINVTQNNDLEIKINASKTEDINFGETILFYITVYNHGPSNATNIIANFKIPNIFTYISDNSGGYYLTSTGEWLIGNLGSGENTTLIITCNLTTMGICTANTTVNSTYTDKNLSNNYDEINLTATAIFDLNITAYWNLTNNTLPWSELANLTIIISNKGPDNATNVTVQINVPGVSYIGDNSGGKFNNLTFTWNVGNLTVGEYKNITITFQGETCGFYWTTGNITAHGYDNNTNDNNYTLNLTIIPVVDLVMTNLTVNATFTGVDNILEFNVTVYNRGPCNATNTTIVGLLPSGWTIYGGSTIADIPVNTSHTFCILVNASTYGNFTVGFNATINGIDSYPLDNHKYIGPIEVIYHADIMITIKTSNLYPATGDMVVYVITVTNLDWRTAHNVTANITIPTNLTFNHHYLASGTYNPSNGTWNIGNLSYRNSTTLFLFTKINTPGLTSFWVNVTGDDYDFHLENNNDTINIISSPGLDLNITITTDNNTPYTGNNLTFTVTVENIGLVDATDVAVDINIPTGFINPRSDDLNFTGNSWYVGNLTSGSSRSLNFTAIPITTNNLTINTTVSASKYDFNITNNFDNITVSPQSASDLQVKITANNINPKVNENVTYTITVYNNGLINVNNVFVYNNLPFSLAYATSTPLYNPTIKMWMITNLAPGETQTLNITINHTTTGIFNYTANITGNTIDTNTSNNLDNITITVADDNDLKIEFTASNNSVIDEGLLNFTITVINEGLYNNTNVIVYTDLPTTKIYNSSEIFDTIQGLWNVGNLSAGENKTITLTINMTNVGNYTYWANTTGYQKDRNLTNNNQSLNVSIYADYDLQVNITVNNQTPNINDTITFTITITNHGPSTAHNIQVINNIYGTQTGISKGTYTGNTWNLTKLNPGETQTLNITIKPNNNGTHTYQTEITADHINADKNNTNNKDNITINVTNNVDLIINITTNASLVNKGDSVELTINVYNNASITATNVLIETTNLFNNILSISSTTGLVSSDSWLIFSLAPHTTETLTIIRTINNQTHSSANISSNNQETKWTNNFANTTINIIKETDLLINISVNQTNIHMNDKVTFTITVSNIGNDSADNITVKLDIPYTINYDNVYMYDALQGIWSIGELENNTSITFNITATINTIGIITYNATVNTTTTDTNPTNNHNNITLNVTSLIDLEITLSSNITNTLYSHETFIIFVNVTNHGPSNATGVFVNLNIPGTTYSTNNGTYTAGIWNIGNLNKDETVNLNITCNLSSTNNGVYKVNVTSTETDKNILNNNATINLTIIDQSDLEVQITSTTNETDLLNTLTYTVTVINHGIDSVSDAIVEFIIPVGFNLTSNMSSNGVFNGTHWKLNTLGVGMSGIANLYLTGHYTQYGNQTIKTHINSTNKDNNLTNNIDNISVWITPICDLRLNFTSTGYYNPDGTITFNITITNNGPCNATNIKIYTNLDTTDNYNETIGYYDPLQKIWYISELNIGQTETLILNTTYSSGTLVYANVTTNTKEQDLTNNIKYLNITLIPLADLNVNITVNNSNPIYGETVTFTITATNLGKYNASNVTVYTNLPPSGSYILSKGLFDTVNGNWSIGNLTVGEIVTLNITINITNNSIYNTNITGSINDTNLTNNNDTINITLINVADLSIKLTLNQTELIIGDNITITINITNNGPNSAENVTINITLPDGFNPDSTYNWTINNLPNNTFIEYNITGIITTNGTKKITANTTSITYDNNTNNNQDTLTFTVNNTVDLIITIQSNTTNILAGESINLIINVTNIGNGTAKDVIVKTNIFNATGDKTGYYDKDTGYWYIGNLNPNNTSILNITLQIIENTTYTVNVNTTNHDINTTNNNDTLNITVTPTANLNITVNTNSKTLYLDDEIIYTIIVTNNGYNNAENVTVYTNLNNNSFNFTSANTTDFNNLTGIWIVGNLTPQTSAILIVKYKANNTGNITTTFNTTTTTNETQLNDNTLNTTITILNTTKPITNLVDLIINITVDNPTSNINNTINFNITIYNNASTTATNLTIINTLPNNITPIGFYTGIWNITSLAPYANISFTFQANVTDYGSFVTNVSVDSLDWDVNPVNNRANCLIVCNAPTGDYTDLTINVTRTGNLTIEGLIKYIINVTNIGPSMANNVNVTTSIFEGLKYVNDNSTGEYNFSDSLWNVGNLNPGETKSLEITLNITQTGHYTDAFIVYSDEMDSKPQNNLIIDSFQINDTSIDLNIRITANKTFVKENETIKFTITIKNPTPNTATNVNITLNIPTEFNITNFPGYTNGSYYIGTLNSLQTYNLTFTAKLNSTNSSTITVNITLNETDSNYFDNSDTITITPLNGNINGVADLFVNITVNEQYPELGSVPIFNIWVTNNGPDDATNVVVPMFVPDGCTSTSVLTPPGTMWDNTNSTFFIPNISVGTTVALEVSFRINTTNPILFNVTARSDQLDPNITDNTASISLYPWEPVPTCDLNITIIPIGNEFHANDTVTLNVTIRNIGNKTAYNITVQNIIPSGLTLQDIKSTWAYTNTTNGWFMGNHTINTPKSFLVTYKINNKGLYHTTMNVNSSTFDIDPTNNGAGIAIYAGDAEPVRRNVTTKTTANIGTATLSLSTNNNWTFKGTLKMANTTSTPTQNFQGQKLYANITCVSNPSFNLIVESIDETSNTGVANFRVSASQLTGTGNYKVTIFYKGEKTDDTYYLPSNAPTQTKRVTINP